MSNRQIRYIYSNVKGGKRTFTLISILKRAKITPRTVNKNMYYVCDKRFSDFGNENLNAVILPATSSTNLRPTALQPFTNTRLKNIPQKIYYTELKLVDENLARPIYLL